MLWRKHLWFIKAFCFCATLALAVSGATAQDSSPPLLATDSRLGRQFDKLENFVDTGLASSNSTKTRRQSARVIDDTPRIPYSYVVFGTFKNNGGKTIAAFEWDYVLTDKKDPQREILRLTVRSEAKIKPGRKREVESRARRGLDHIWKIRQTADVAVIVTRVEYADGSLWEAGKLTETKEP
jgi:hypothetical protein